MELTSALADAGVPAFLVILPGIQRATAGELARCQERMREGGDERLRWVEGGRLRVGEGVRLRA